MKLLKYTYTLACCKQISDEVLSMPIFNKSIPITITHNTYINNVCLVLIDIYSMRNKMNCNSIIVRFTENIIISGLQIRKIEKKKECERSEYDEKSSEFVLDIILYISSVRGIHLLKQKKNSSVLFEN